MDADRYERGLKKLLEIDGKAGIKAIEDLKDIAPDIEKILVEYPFGEIYSRPALDTRSREVAAIAALTALGNAKPQLKVHIHAALNAGCTTDEIVEVILQMTVYAGFPAAINALYIAKEVFEGRNLKNKS
ncbi:MAG: carboxymuconolactone decarboxylase family protein [Candidatus Krumholzibacteria bacterium]|nr:carboxymuconolactone decarboxylase family protein [Candidatus Krumholzibacteria bacterium]